MSNDLLDSTIQRYLPAAAGGDAAAYGRIVRDCQAMVASVALSIVRDVPASEDIAQEAFLSAWQNLRKLGNPASFLPWLRQITRNLARDHLRSQYHRANPPGDVDALIAAVADPHPGPETTLAERQEAQVAADVIDALPAESREVLLLYYREGQSSKQVAALLGMQDAAVRKRLSRARQCVREELLQRLANFAKASAPGGAFTASVMAALTLASPPAAAAALLGTTGGALLGKGGAKLLLGGVGAAGLGIAAAMAGVWWGLRKFLRNPHDDAEKRALVRYGLAMTAIIVVFLFAIIGSTARPGGWQGPVLATALYALAICGMANFWLPAILARRRAHEAKADPVGVAALRSFGAQWRYVLAFLSRSPALRAPASAIVRQRRKDVLCAWGGTLIGLTLAFGSLLIGLTASGRL